MGAAALRPSFSWSTQWVLVKGFGCNRTLRNEGE
jgi:hypothetical protein